MYLYLYLHSCATANESNVLLWMRVPANVFICMRTTGSAEACSYANVSHDYRSPQLPSLSLPIYPSLTQSVSILL